MIKNIIFDIGNVLGKFRWDELLEELQITGETFEQVANATVRNSKWWNEFDRSELSDEEIIAGCVACAPNYEKEIRLLFENCATFVREYSYSKDWIVKLKERGYKVYLLSNYARTAFEGIKNNFQFYPIVDGEVISYQINIVKPDVRIYETLLEKYSLKAEECVFLDDREENIEAAKKLGFHGIVFTSKEEAEVALEKIIEMQKLL